MGFRLSIVISTPIEPDLHQEILDAARVKWPFIRTPRHAGKYRDRMLFAGPELTEYLFNAEADSEQASQECSELETQLPSLSRRFETVTFAYIAADCFGGTCLYYGFCCRDGTVFSPLDADYSAHLALLSHVGVSTRGHFPPFVRGFFTGRGSGGFE